MEEAPAESGTPPSVWWALAAAGLAALLALVVGVPLGRRRSWDSNLDAAELEAGWFARELLPDLQQPSTPDEVAGGWKIAGVRVVSLEDRLTGLASSAPDEARGLRAVALRDAVRTARGELDDLMTYRDPETLAGDLDRARSRLEEALPPRPSTS